MVIEVVNMKIKIIPGGIFQVKCPKLPAELILEFPGETVSIHDVLHYIVDQYGEESVLEALVAVNHVLIQDNTTLMNDGDCIHLFSPAFGG
jgi:molybdopterin converting factor small subunit